MHANRLAASWCLPERRWCQRSPRRPPGGRICAGLSRCVVMNLSRTRRLHRGLDTRKCSLSAVSISGTCRGARRSCGQTSPRVVSASAQAVAAAVMKREDARISPGTKLCTSITASTVAEAIEQIATTNNCGADILELRLDVYLDFEMKAHLQLLVDACEVPCIVTCRPHWEGCVTAHNLLALTGAQRSRLLATSFQSCYRTLVQRALGGR
jgi:Type I 3-dehydroquinase